MSSATAAARPVVSVRDASSGAVTGNLPLPAVFTVPIRRDVVHTVHSNMAKNARQAYAVSRGAGHQSSAESWGTGRAVSRVPRVGGGGTSRSGQGTFGNMCRGGHMFNPTRTWRKWHVAVPRNQRRYATASALAASAIPALVMARGHKIDSVDEIPLVLDNGNVAKTKEAVEVLARFGANDDVDRCRDSKKLRVGKGKMRNRRYQMRRGPLIVYSGDRAFEQAYRNLPGVELCEVSRLNLLQLAPGGHMGRFIVWTKDAFAALDTIFGTYDAAGSKSGFSLPRGQMFNADLARLINSTEVQDKVRGARTTVKFAPRKNNPLRNKVAMLKLNPYAETMRKTQQRAQDARKASRKTRLAAKRKERRTQSLAFHAALLSDE